jgi:hypothetical protein
VEVKLESGKKLIKRFENVQRAQQEFWRRWIEEVFPQRLKQSKWKQEKRDLKTGDIVLRKDETAAGQTYKYAKVVKVHTSTDVKVRAADVEYKLPGESVFRMTTRPIHKLVLNSRRGTDFGGGQGRRSQSSALDAKMYRNEVGNSESGGVENKRRKNSYGTHATPPSKQGDAEARHQAQKSDF